MGQWSKLKRYSWQSNLSHAGLCMQAIKVQNQQCSCIKNNKLCGPWCSCYNCYNGEGKHSRRALICIRTLTHLFDDNQGDHSEKGSSCTSNVVEELPPQLAAQSEDEQTSSDEDRLWWWRKARSRLFSNCKMWSGGAACYWMRNASNNSPPSMLVDSVASGDGIS